MQVVINCHNTPLNSLIVINATIHCPKLIAWIKKANDLFLKSAPYNTANVSPVASLKIKSCKCSDYFRWDIEKRLDP